MRILTSGLYGRSFKGDQALSEEFMRRIAPSILLVKHINQDQISICLFLRLRFFLL
jgi:hypothetical protein